MNKHGLLLLLLFIAGVPLASADLDVSEAWIQYLPPVIPVRAGYMLIDNNTTKAIQITAIESEVFTRIDIHETVEKDGMMTMRPVGPLEIPAGKTVKLEPGGLHLMMRNPARALQPGDNVDVMLHLDSGKTQLINMTVNQKPNE